MDELFFVTDKVCRVGLKNCLTSSVRVVCDKYCFLFYYYSGK